MIRIAAALNFFYRLVCLLLRCRLLSVNFVNEHINCVDKIVDIIRKRFATFDLAYLTAEVVDRFEQQVKQLRPILFRNDIHRIFTDQEEQILNTMCNRHERFELHHRRRAFQRVHDAENFIHIILGKRIRLFSRQHDIVKLFQQCICFVQVHFQNAIAVIFHKINAAFLKN